MGRQKGCTSPIVALIAGFIYRWCEYPRFGFKVLFDLQHHGKQAVAYIVFSSIVVHGRFGCV